MPFDINALIRRNRDVALARYGELLDENRCVKGTDIWFDSLWRMHRGELKKELKREPAEGE